MNNSVLLETISANDLRVIISDEVKKGVESALKDQKQKPEVEFITRKDAASILGISLVTLNEWTKTGRVPAYRINTRVRYKLHEVYACANKIKVA